jgi:hypothetical protein
MVVEAAIGNPCLISFQGKELCLEQMPGAFLISDMVQERIISDQSQKLRDAPHHARTLVARLMSDLSRLTITSFRATGRVDIQLARGETDRCQPNVQTRQSRLSMQKDRFHWRLAVTGHSRVIRVAFGQGIAKEKETTL